MSNAEKTGGRVENSRYFILAQALWRKQPVT